MKSYFAYSLTIGAIVALNFGLNTVNFNASKEFAIVDFGWCKDEVKPYECTTATTYSSLISGGTFIGGAIGSLLIGAFSKYGRRKGMMIIHIINIVGSALATAAPCFTVLLLGRMIAGVAVGASGLVAIFLTEICTSDTRGLYGTVYPLFITTGQLLMNAWQLLHGRVLGADNAAVKDNAITTLDQFVWRMAQFWPIVFSVIALVIMFVIVKDDTPYVLLDEGKDEDAKRVITLLHGEEKAEQIYSEIKSDVEAQKASATKLTLMEALKIPKCRYGILVVCGLSVMQQVSGINVFVANASKLFVSIMGRTFVANLMGLAGIVALLITVIVLIFIIEKFGRKTLLMTGIGISTISMVPPVIVKMCVEKNTRWADYFMVAGCMGFMVGFGLGFGGVMWLYFAEALGTDYKDAAFGVATCLNWCAAAAVLMTSDILLSWNDNFTYALYAGFGVVPLGHHVSVVESNNGDDNGHADKDGYFSTAFWRVLTCIVGEVLNQRPNVREEGQGWDGCKGGQAVVTNGYIGAAKDVAHDGRWEEWRKPDHGDQLEPLLFGGSDKCSVVLVVSQVSVHQSLQEVPRHQEAKEHSDEVCNKTETSSNGNTGWRTVYTQVMSTYQFVHGDERR
ncbi:hypothetical protein BaOVIS_030240 [Babesia ovis]|uniref:Hexose transporter 1 n=1 Tax=Babesia ovis TaxID=5869 RepID=A0A9W5WW07_BABOV|nr:hypothetical protein BaOVIS_030240 [Babesia ovis]